MICPVHHVWTSTCGCAVAGKPGWPARLGDRVESVELAGKRLPGLVKPVMLALTFAGAVVACGPRPAVCTERDAALIATEVDCLARVKSECAGIPLDKPCPFEDECNRKVQERCK